jgi:anti-sigma regulatory factor (Ser/Thr protein kinase)
VKKHEPKEHRPAELTVPADLGQVDKVRLFLRRWINGLGLGEEDAMKLELSLHEIFVNIALYAYPDGRPGTMTLRIWNDAGVLYMEIRDRGIPFDPAEKPTPDLEEIARLGTRGGLGVFLFKTLMDGYAYRRDGDENVLTVHKTIAG